MCGRFTVTLDPAQLALNFAATNRIGADLQPQPVGRGEEPAVLVPTQVRLPNYNAAPTTPVMLLAEVAGHRQLLPARWALVPGWAKALNSGPVVFNARAETITTKPYFRSSVKTMRGVVPASGWYEWQQIPGQKTKQPCHMHSADGEPLYFAAVYALWTLPVEEEFTLPEGEVQELPQVLISTAIVTTAAVGDLALVHDRMPRLLDTEEVERWLDCTDGVPLDLLEPVSAQRAAGIVIDAVGGAVGNTRNNSPELITPLPTAEGLF